MHRNHWNRTHITSKHAEIFENHIYSSLSGSLGVGEHFTVCDHSVQLRAQDPVQLLLAERPSTLAGRRLRQGAGVVSHGAHVHSGCSGEGGH